MKRNRQRQFNARSYSRYLHKYYMHFRLILLTKIDIRDKINMNKLAKIIDELGPEDLMKIKRDLVAGNIDRLVEKKLNDLSKLNISEKQCPVCSGMITENALVLEFGPAYLRRRAYFDAVDCLNYFADVNLKQKTEEKKI